MNQYDRLHREMQAQQAVVNDEVDWDLVEDEDDSSGFDFYRNRRPSSSNPIDYESGTSQSYFDEEPTIETEYDFLSAEGFTVEDSTDSASLEDKLDNEAINGPFSDGESKTVLTEAIEKAVSTGNTGLVALTAIGRDTSTGSYSNSAILNNLISKLPSESFQPRMEQVTGEDGEIVYKVASTFDENERKQLEDIIIRTVQTKKAINHLHSGEDFHKRLKEVNDMIKTIRREIKLQELSIGTLEETYDGLKPFYELIIKERNQEQLTHEEVLQYEKIVAVGLATVVKSFNNAERDYMSATLKLQNNYDALKLAKESRKKIEEELAKSKEEIVSSPMLDKARRVITNMSKITQVQFGYSLRDRNFREEIVGLTCGCGHTDVYNYNLLPKFICGDILGDFKGRSKTNSGTSNNYFDTSKSTKESRTKYTLLKANEDTYLASRLVIPGVTVEGEAMMCTKCEKFLLFTPEIYRAMAEKGHMQDIWLFEYSKSEEGKTMDLKNGLTLYISEDVLSSVYLADLGLNAYKANIISARASKVDSIPALTGTKLNTKTSLISEDYLHEYSKENGISMDLSKVEANLMNKAGTLNSKLSEIILAENKKANSSKQDKNGKKETARINAEFLSTYRDIILEWAFHEDFTADLLRINVNNLLNDLTGFGRLVSELTVRKSLESIVSGKPILIFEKGRLISIENKQANLPHAKFIACYYDLVFNHIMNIHRKLRTGEQELYSVHKVFFEIQKISNMTGNAALTASEDLVVSLIRMLGNTYYEQRPIYFDNYSGAREFDLNFTEDNYTSDWIYYEMVSQSHMLRHAQPLDEAKFAYRYGRRLHQEGVTDIYVKA